MANGTTHQLAAAVAIGLACVCAEADHQKTSAKPVVAAALSAALTNLPDVLEPASHPNHRQFFYSFVFAARSV